jgi:hypothetical protein
MAAAIAVRGKCAGRGADKAKSDMDVVWLAVKRKMITLLILID